jgi:hypothetical protein
MNSIRILILLISLSFLLILLIPLISLSFGEGKTPLTST